MVPSANGWRSAIIGTLRGESVLSWCKLWDALLIYGDGIVL